MIIVTIVLAIAGLLVGAGGDASSMMVGATVA